MRLQDPSPQVRRSGPPIRVGRRWKHGREDCLTCFSRSISRLEDRLHALEDLLGSVVSKVGLGPEAANHSLQHNTPPHSRASLPVDDSSEPREDVNVAELPFTSNAMGDTVDGMGVVTFADEVTSRYFG